MKEGIKRTSHSWVHNWIIPISHHCIEHCSSTHNSYDMESTYQRMIKENMVCMHYGIVLSHKRMKSCLLQQLCLVNQARLRETNTYFVWYTAVDMEHKKLKWSFWERNVIFCPCLYSNGNVILWSFYLLNITIGGKECLWV